MRRTALAALIVLLACAGNAQQSDRFISISDVHFDPYYDTSLVAQLEATDVSGWAAIFASSKITAPSTYGADTNYPLLQSFLADLKSPAAGARFVTITGDLLGHDFPQDFQLYSPDKSEDAYRSFITKTTQFIAAQIKSAAPSIPIYPVFGNNDSDCGDYEFTPGGWYVDVFAKAWGTKFSASGNYDVASPVPNTRIIGLNTILLSANYDNECGAEDDTTDYGAQTLTWLRRRLESARAKHQRVWLLYHIPPGINVYSTTSSGAACPTPVLMWKSQYAKRFNALMKRYSSTVTASMAGHTHMDDFRLIDKTYIHITPAVSPMFSNNSAYESVDYSRATATITDYTVYNLTTAWAPEYTFTTAYHQPSMTLETMQVVRNDIGTDATTRAQYMQYYTASNPKSTTITQSNWKGYWCGTGAANAKSFTSCYCTAP